MQEGGREERRKEWKEGGREIKGGKRRGSKGREFFSP
jgi:hypothetical protein